MNHSFSKRDTVQPLVVEDLMLYKIACIHVFLSNSKLLFPKDYQNKSSVPQSQFYSLLTQLLDHRDYNQPPECQVQLDSFTTFDKYNGRKH